MGILIVLRYFDLFAIANCLLIGFNLVTGGIGATLLGISAINPQTCLIKPHDVHPSHIGGLGTGNVRKFLAVYAKVRAIAQFWRDRVAIGIGKVRFGAKKAKSEIGVYVLRQL